jgi:hypothetical protein
MRAFICARSAIGSRFLFAVVVSTTFAVSACAGAATSSPSATPAPVAAVDPCLVGTWTVVAQDQNSPANDESITYSGGTGEVFTIDAQGGITIDTASAQPIVFVSAGKTFTATVAGTGRGTVTTLATGPTKNLTFTPSADDTRTTHSFGPSGAELGPARPDTQFSAVYTCAPGRFTFYKGRVDYMVDGPIVTLTSGGGTASTPTPSPS